MNVLGLPKSCQISKSVKFKGVIHVPKTFDVQAQHELIATKKLKSDSFSIFYEPLKTTAAAILSMLKDRANGGRDVFLEVNNFLSSGPILILLMSINFSQS